MPVEKLGEPEWSPHLAPNLQVHLKCGATKPHENMIMAKGETELEVEAEQLDLGYSLFFGCFFQHYSLLVLLVIPISSC